MYSLAQGKLSIPHLWQAKKAHIKGGKLLEQKKELESLYTKLQSKLQLS